MKVETEISKLPAARKALLLQIMDPLLWKEKKGEVVPVHILGTLRETGVWPGFSTSRQGKKDEVTNAEIRVNKSGNNGIPAW